MNYRQIKEEILAKIRDNVDITLDTNIFIEIVVNKDFALLNQLKAYSKFHPTVINHNELRGLMRNRDVGDLAKIAFEFITEKVVAVRMIHADRRKVEELSEALRKVSVLIPRRVASFVVIQFVDNLIQRFRDLTGRKLSDVDFRKLIESYNVEKGELKRRAADYYVETIDTLGINDLEHSVEEEYFKEVDKFIGIMLAQIQMAVTLARGDVNMVIIKLSEFRQKTYDADIRFVAESSATGCNTISNDSDVNWLFIFRAQRLAA